MKITKNIIIILFVCGVTTLTGDNKKLGQTGFQFLSVISDARGSGMAGAMTTIEGHSSSLFYNPAGMARSTNLLEMSFSQFTWIAGIKYSAVSMSSAPASGRYGVFGLTLQSVAYGEFQGTMVWPNDQGFVDTELFYPTALSIGVGYAQSLSDRFSIGGQIKSNYQYLGNSVIPETDSTFAKAKNTANTLAYDFGTIYETHWKDFAFGMSVRNFSQEIKYVIEGFQLPLTFQIGASINLLEFSKLHFLVPPATKNPNLTLSIDAIHPRSFTERMNVGLEYKLFDILYLRYGKLINYDGRGSTFGLGLQKNMGEHFLEIDYAFTPIDYLGDVQKISIRLAF